MSTRIIDFILSVRYKESLLVCCFIEEVNYFLMRYCYSPTIIQTTKAEKELNIEIPVSNTNETSETISSVFTFLSLNSCFRFTQKAASPKSIETTTITVIIIVINSIPSSLKNEYMFRKKRITKRMSWISAAFGRGRFGFFIFGGG